MADECSCGCGTTAVAHEAEKASKCSCGCGTTTQVTQAGEACDCGCECCGNQTMSREEEIAQLTSLRASVEGRLAELGA